MMPDTTDTSDEAVAQVERRLRLGTLSRLPDPEAAATLTLCFSGMKAAEAERDQALARARAAEAARDALLSSAAEAALPAIGRAMRAEAERDRLREATTFVCRRMVMALANDHDSDGTALATAQMIEREMHAALKDPGHE